MKLNPNTRTFSELFCEQITRNLGCGKINVNLKFENFGKRFDFESPLAIHRKISIKIYKDWLLLTSYVSLFSDKVLVEIFPGTRAGDLVVGA